MATNIAIGYSAIHLYDGAMFVGIFGLIFVLVVVCGYHGRKYGYVTVVCGGLGWAILAFAASFWMSDPFLAPLAEVMIFISLVLFVLAFAFRKTLEQRWAEQYEREQRLEARHEAWWRDYQGRLH